MTRSYPSSNTVSTTATPFSSKSSRFATGLVYLDFNQREDFQATLQIAFEGLQYFVGMHLRTENQAQRLYVELEDVPERLPAGTTALISFGPSENTRKYVTVANLREIVLVLDFKESPEVLRSGINEKTGLPVKILDCTIILEDEVAIQKMLRTKEAPSRDALGTGASPSDLLSRRSSTNRLCPHALCINVAKVRQHWDARE